MAKQTMYNRRGWWPDGWSVEHQGREWLVMNKDTAEVLYRTMSENDAIGWADCNASR